MNKNWIASGVLLIALLLSFISPLGVHAQANDELALKVKLLQSLTELLNLRLKLLSSNSVSQEYVQTYVRKQDDVSSRRSSRNDSDNNDEINSSVITNSTFEGASLDTDTLTVNGTSRLTGNVGIGGAPTDSMLSMFNQGTPTSFLTIGFDEDSRYFEVGERTTQIGDVDSVGTGALFTVDHPNAKFTFMNGSVGIGTSTPSTKLSVVGQLNLRQSADVDSIIISNNNESFSGDWRGQNIFIGGLTTNANGDAEGNVVIGNSAQSYGGGNDYFNTVIGYGARATAHSPSNVVIGALSEGGSSNVVALGRSAKALGASSIAIGSSATASSTYGLAIGQSVSVTGTRSAGIGNLMTIAQNDSYVYGYDVDGALGGATLHGFGTITPSARLHVRGTGATSATNALTVDNSSSTNLLTVRNDGNIGIGTSSPSVKLHVHSSTDTNDIFHLRSGNTYLYAGAVSADNYASIGAYHATDGATDLILNYIGGNVGVGTTSPQTKLDVYGDILASGSSRYINFGSTSGSSGYGFRDNAGTIQYKNSGGGWTTFASGASGLIQPTVGNSASYGIMFPTDPGGGGGDTAFIRYFVESGENTKLRIGTDNDSEDDIAFWQSGADRVIIQNAGAVRFTAYGSGTLTTDSSGNITASSDEQLKDIQGGFMVGLKQLRGVTPIAYKWNSESGLETENMYYGFSAQNVQAFIPEAVGQDPRGYLTLSDRPLLAATINAVKEIDLKIEDLVSGESYINEEGVEQPGLFARMLAWAEDKIFKAEEVHTEKLCVGGTCITENELRDFLDSREGPTIAEPHIPNDPEPTVSTEDPLPEAQEEDLLINDVEEVELEIVPTIVEELEPDEPEEVIEPSVEPEAPIE